MNRIILIPMIAVAAGTSLAATPGAVESWGAGSAEGWMNVDPLNLFAATVPPVSSSGYVEVVFVGQSMPFPGRAILRGDASASGGKFVDDYWRTGVTNMGFKLYCSSSVPDTVKMWFYSPMATNVSRTNEWEHALPLPTSTNSWTQYSMEMSYTEGWTLRGPETETNFLQGLSKVAWVGIQIDRNGTNRQTYGVDDFTINGASATLDSDGDGMYDLAEVKAGTSSSDSGSVFRVTTGSEVPGAEPVIHWNSATLRRYGVWRSESMQEAFVPVATNIAATPPENVFTNVGTAGTGPYFYKVKVEEP